MLSKLKLALAFTLLASAKVFSGPADYMYLPVITKGEREIDFKYGTSKNDSGVRKNVSKLGLGYSPTDYWFTEVYAMREKEGGHGLTIAEWENKFQFTETGKYLFEVGMITEIEAPLQKHNPYELKLGPLFQTDINRVQLNANFLFEREFGPNPKHEKRITELGYQFQTKYRYRKEFEFGLQGFGELGEWNDWDKYKNQNHRWGPAVFGKINIGAAQKFKYNAALLYGVNDAAPNYTSRMQLEYEF
ncbi:MAG: hypothetical protein EXR41_03405 [Candidatus Methylopumilus sp.]|nr:hypothetical protein [Candidatus Methylopumilus sp.]